MRMKNIAGRECAEMLTLCDEAHSWLHATDCQIGFGTATHYIF